jgi:hypothetical protein
MLKVSPECALGYKNRAIDYIPGNKHVCCIVGRVRGQVERLRWICKVLTYHFGCSRE